jgi:hypothetical protein
MDRGKTVYPPPPSGQKSDIWSQASYRYPISWEAFLDPSDSYFLFVDFVDFYTHLTYICICTFFVAFFSATIDDRNLIFGEKCDEKCAYTDVCSMCIKINKFDKQEVII